MLGPEVAHIAGDCSGVEGRRAVAGTTPAGAIKSTRPEVRSDFVLNVKVVFVRRGSGAEYSWVWAYVLSQLLAMQINDPFTQPDFYTQLGLHRGYNDTRRSIAYSRDTILLTPDILIAGAVALVISAFSARI